MCATHTYFCVPRTVCCHFSRCCWPWQTYCRTSSGKYCPWFRLHKSSGDDIELTALGKLNGVSFVQFRFSNENVFAVCQEIVVFISSFLCFSVALCCCVFPVLDRRIFSWSIFFCFLVNFLVSFLMQSLESSIYPRTCTTFCVLKLLYSTQVHVCMLMNSHNKCALLSRRRKGVSVVQ